MCFAGCFGSRLEALRRELKSTREELSALRKWTGDSWTIVDAAERDITRKFECKICMNSIIDTVLLPCGHALSCTECTKESKTCPVCTMPIEGRTQIKFA